VVWILQQYRHKWYGDEDWDVENPKYDKGKKFKGGEGEKECRGDKEVDWEPIDDNRY
jgi:hypothetical protein